MPEAHTPGKAEIEVLDLWYELGRACSEAGYARSRAIVLGFTVALVTGSLVLLSVPFFGTAWAGPFAPLIPVAAGLLAGCGLIAWTYVRASRQSRLIGDLLAEKGYDARRPARGGLGAYYDTQLILLRSEYEFLLMRGARKTARIFEESFGFTPEDPFECGPLNVRPDTGKMRALRERWERRLAMKRERGSKPPALGLREDLAYRVFPREMTVIAEVATRRAYLAISRDLLRRHYGRNPRKRADSMPEDIRRRMEWDLEEYATLTRRPG